MHAMVQCQLGKFGTSLTILNVVKPRMVRLEVDAGIECTVGNEIKLGDVMWEPVHLCEYE